MSKTMGRIKTHYERDTQKISITQKWFIYLTFLLKSDGLYFVCVCVFKVHSFGINDTKTIELKSPETRTLQRTRFCCCFFFVCSECKRHVEWINITTKTKELSEWFHPKALKHTKKWHSPERIILVFFFVLFVRDVSVTLIHIICIFQISVAKQPTDEREKRNNTKQ